MSSNDDRPHGTPPPLPRAATYAHGAARPFHTPPPGRPKRDLAVLEELTESVATKLALVERTVEKLEESCATKADVKAVYLEARQARRLLTEHIDHARQEAQAAARRDEAIMGMLGDIIGRLPVQLSPTSSLPPTAEISPSPNASREAPPAPDSSSKRR